MARQTALPANLPPRLITREKAAAYISVSSALFDRMVQDGLMPPPKSLGDKRKAWDIRELDEAIDRLPSPRGGLGDEAINSDMSWRDVDGP
jgi:predicted DNA-binding transcriptional regulator AlpA